ncbi:hypothetical protein [Amycolatopsis nigrescens]|uniref:hypothetical protein n=1 Tax=Amycolatopsis nigrescens TaxID=381445 RepID=UPI001B7F88D1|nr:hypothetical protein [Amycolatopsis nigrescens]
MTASKVFNQRGMPDWLSALAMADPDMTIIPSVSQKAQSRCSGASKSLSTAFLRFGFGGRGAPSALDPSFVAMDA